MDERTSCPLLVREMSRLVRGPILIWYVTQWYAPLNIRTKPLRGPNHLVQATGPNKIRPKLRTVYQQRTGLVIWPGFLIHTIL